MSAHIRPLWAAGLALLAGLLPMTALHAEHPHHAPVPGYVEIYPPTSTGGVYSMFRSNGDNPYNGGKRPIWGRWFTVVEPKVHPDRLRWYQRPESIAPIRIAR
ncbi:hypothetical protein [Tuwongella immobilis]|uniref:Uncharacterized protein n=1 Tax=Tuwongella immobilis TaxID=692036 RepID=A0A6C2YJH2_9BACT|nr:hypothetical protein [Tuwongella immobilis]VIP01718.1 unnamed protein product [Tuwongella immobilis]VTR99242.1 unnamed protein product [Tuwongella immobilis]